MPALVSMGGAPLARRVVSHCRNAVHDVGHCGGAAGAVAPLGWAGVWVVRAG